LSMSGDLVQAVEPLLDWGLTEQCLAYNQCDAWRAVTGAGKTGFMVEYGSAGNIPSLCPEADRLGFELLIKRPVLDAFRIACPSP
jgi:Glycoside-hydrolase family GH114